jgi:23S rRNA U2552 (ribose-2'-O)-methylase RlmE/FtsJ
VWGLDGFTALFCKRYWSIVGSDALDLVWGIFKENILLQEQNHTFVALVPKTRGPHSVDHFRTISLCNIVHKLVSKILASQLKAHLPKFISPLQLAFVLDRNI